MNLFSVGISHHTASVDVREKMWLSEEEIRRALPELKEHFFSECVLVSTCNRTELYGMFPSGSTPDESSLTKFLIDFKQASGLVQPAHFQGRDEGSAVEQLFRVAAGVDSMVIGDIQILSQVKDAFNLARQAAATGPVMNRLMQASLHVGKRVRTETVICEGAVSVSYAAVELASKIFADLSRKSVLLIGAGETGELTLKHIVGRGIGQVKIANRTREKADALVALYGGSVVDFAGVGDALAGVDIVITSVNSPTYILGPEEVQKVMRQRSNSPLIVLDIGVPRNVNPASRRIENVFLYDIDSLNTVVDKNLERRKAELPKVNAIVREEVAEFYKWYNALQVGPTIQELRDMFESVRQQEVGKNINRFKSEDRELVELVTKRIVNKLLHQPMTILKQGTEGGNGEAETLSRIQTLRDLFGMSGSSREPDEQE
jgi:glutamyl-tRNA reductase